MKIGKNKASIIVYIACLLIAVLFILVGYNLNRTEVLEEETTEFYKARIESIENIETETFGSDYEFTAEMKTITFKAIVTSGPYENEIVEATQIIDSYMVTVKEVDAGNRVIVTPISSEESTSTEWIFIEYDRTMTLLWVTLIFLLLILLIGRGKGVATIIALVFTVLSVFYVFIPSILKGRNIYVSTIIVGSFIIVISLIMMNGASKKTLCAIVGNLGGVVVAGLIAYMVNKSLNLSGFVDEDFIFLTYLDIENPIDLVAIIWSGIVIGSLGAVMDVAMSIASAMNELSVNMEEKTFSRMLKSGMNIGQDTIGTMTNTLILAYVGSSLATVLLLTAYNKDLLYLFSLEMIVVEVLQAMVGSMGIFFAVPATALFSAYVFTKVNQKKSRL